MNNKIKIAIDGPAGAGKSTVAKLVASKLSFLYIDTGAMYRALTYAALMKGVNLEKGTELKKLLDTIDIRLSHDKEGGVFLDELNVTELIRGTDVTANVSIVASHADIRTEMVHRQRQLSKQGNTVLDGRDIGTHVLPDAQLKIFLTASVDERAKRRYEEQINKGMPSNLPQIKKDIAHRDLMDSTRDIAPLKKADDAIEIDSTTQSIQEVTEAIIELVKERMS